MAAVKSADLVAVTATGEIDSSQVTLRYTGISSGIPYVQQFIQDQLFADTSAVIDTRESVTAKSLSALRTPDESIALEIISLHRDDIYDLAVSNDLMLPLRVHMVVDVTGTWEDLTARLSRREVKRYAKWRENPRHSLRLSHDADEYFWFYENMVIPSMTNTYGVRSRTLSARDGYQQVFKNGGLFLVEVDGEPVAGSVASIDYGRRCIAGRIIGVKNGDQAYRKDGAQNAVYHAIIEWARENRFSWVDFGNSESFLSKGTFQYKMRLGTHVILPPGTHSDFRTLIRWNSAFPPVVEFLINNPVILIQESPVKLGAGYFCTASRPPRREISYLPTTGLSFERTITL